MPDISLKRTVKAIESSVLSIIGHHLSNLWNALKDNPRDTSDPIHYLPTKSTQDTPTKVYWDQVPPSLGYGPNFSWERMDLLQQAINTLHLDKQTDRYKDSLDILHDHATNYGDDGPQKLALLWCKWDP